MLSQAEKLLFLLLFGCLWLVIFHFIGMTFPKFAILPFAPFPWRNLAAVSGDASSCWCFVPPHEIKALHPVHVGVFKWWDYPESNIAM